MYLAYAKPMVYDIGLTGIARITCMDLPLIRTPEIITTSDAVSDSGAREILGPHRRVCSPACLLKDHDRVHDLSHGIRRHMRFFTHDFYRITVSPEIHDSFDRLDAVCLECSIKRMRAVDVRLFKSGDLRESDRGNLFSSQDCGRRVKYLLHNSSVEFLYVESRKIITYYFCLSSFS